MPFLFNLKLIQINHYLQHILPSWVLGHSFSWISVHATYMGYLGYLLSEMPKPLLEHLKANISLVTGDSGGFQVWLRDVVVKTGA